MQMEEIQVRPYRPSTDFRAVLDAQCDLYSLNFPRFVCTPQFLAEQGARLRQAARRPYEHQLFVLDDGGQVAGFIWTVIRMDLQGVFGSVDQVYLRPGYRGRRLGERLMEAAHQHLSASGVNYARLFVTDSNQGAVALYRRVGYDVIRLEMERPL
jgi:ribosomal protein S18 acetylase RimI-like enzyme